MYKREIEVKNETGLHARPASMFVNLAGTFKSKIELQRLGEEDLWYLGLPDGRCLPLRLGSFRRSGERERLEELRLWYICGPEGLSEVVRDPIRGVYLVSEGLGAGDLEPALLGLLGPGMLEPLDLPF